MSRILHILALTAASLCAPVLWDTQECVTAARLPNGAVIEYRTDAFGRVIEVEDATTRQLIGGGIGVHFGK